MSVTRGEPAGAHYVDPGIDREGRYRRKSVIDRQPAMVGCSPHSGPPLRLASRARFPVAAKLRSEQSEIDDVEPAEDPVDNRPQDRMVGRVRNRDREG